MTTGVKTLRLERRWLLMLCALLASCLASPAWALDLATVAAQLAQRKGGEARFTEERFVSGFDSPFRASGTLSFSAPERFARYTAEPRAESMVVDGNSLVLNRGGRSRQMALDAVPEVAALIQAVRGTLTGNALTLDKHFKVRVEGSAAQWTLALVPRDARLATQVREIRIAGLAGDVRSVELWLAGGDRSLMLIGPLIGPLIDPLIDPPQPR